MQTAGLILIINAEVYTPLYVGKMDMLIGGGKILQMAAIIPVEGLKGLEAEVLNAAGKILIPGLIDAHVHIAGAGGEGGPSTRTPEMKLQQMLHGGITTVVGCLGTDGITRSPESVLMKARSLKQKGVSAYMFTGSYQVPTPTITGSIARDLTLIEEVIGVGEVALSDHRSSCPNTDQLIQLAAEARVGGMLGGKAGIVNIHMGDAKNPFEPIMQAVKNSQLPIKQFFPTHCNRNSYIFDDAKVYGKQGYVDLTASSYPYFPEEEIKPSKAVVQLIEAGVPEAHITLTSDGNGSLPGFDQHGNLIKLELGQPASIFTEWKDMVLDEKMPIQTALSVVTSNVAGVLKLKSKGKLVPGADADLVLLDNHLSISDVMAMGKWAVKNYEQCMYGNFE